MIDWSKFPYNKKPYADITLQQMSKPKLIQIIRDYEHDYSVLYGALPIKRGTWIGIDDFPYEDFECSCCGAQMLGDDKIPQEMHYCPNCGADMREVQDG